MILETTFLIKETSKQKETKDGDKFFSALIEIQKKDWDFGVRTEEMKFSTDKDLSIHKGKRVKVKIEIYVNKSAELAFRLLEVIP